MYNKGNLQCLFSVHVDDIKGVATRDVVDPLLKHLNTIVGQRKTYYISSLHTGMQHEHSSGAVFTHQCVYIGSITPIDTLLLIGNGGEELCDSRLRGAYRSVFGAVACIALTRAELAVYVQVLQRRAHAPQDY